MLKIVAVLMTLLFTPQTQVVNLDLANKVLDQSVLIRAKQFSMGEDLVIKKALIGCSGTYVSNGTVLTAAHCFSSSSITVWVRGYNGTSHQAIVVKLDPDHDLALLAVRGPYKHPVAKLAPKNSMVGESVISVGSPFSFEFLLSEGVVALNNYKDRSFKAHYLIHTGMINSGSSGGGAFNAKGELIGVNTMTVGGPFGWAGITMSVDLKTIREFLK